jgi:hypothetical protein
LADRASPGAEARPRAQLIFANRSGLFRTGPFPLEDRMLKRAAASIVASAGLLGAGLFLGNPAGANEYPTDVVADYVIGCMVSNGETQDALHRCSCSIDTIASILPYEKYERGETVLMMRQATGQQASVFKSMQSLKKMVDDLRLAQIEADFRCF